MRLLKAKTALMYIRSVFLSSRRFVRTRINVLSVFLKDRFTRIRNTISDWRSGKTKRQLQYSKLNSQLSFARALFARLNEPHIHHDNELDQWLQRLADNTSWEETSDGWMPVQCAWSRSVPDCGKLLTRILPEWKIGRIERITVPKKDAYFSAVLVNGQEEFHTSRLSNHREIAALNSIVKLYMRDVTTQISEFNVF